MDAQIFSFPTLIHFGSGVSKTLPQYLRKQGFKAPLVITDRSIPKLPFFSEFLECLKKSDLQATVFSGVFGNPVEAQVTQGVQEFSRSHSDSIIGLGGGAALDVAKAVALMSSHPGQIFDYEEGAPGFRAVDQPIPFWVAVPTTSGTGSEVGRSTVISSEKDHIKHVIFSPVLLAKAVFADPELTLSMPPSITAATGMDALTHCIESYLAKSYHPICDGIALEGLRLAALHLEASVRQPQNILARSSMLMCSMMGAIAFQKGLGLTHSCAHALSTAIDLHHGLANGIMIDHALKFNLSAVPEKFLTMAQTIGLANPSSEGFIHWLSELKMKIEIPAQLSFTRAWADRGFSRPDDFIHSLSHLAYQDGCHQNNPRSCAQADFKEIFTEAVC